MVTFPMHSSAELDIYSTILYVHVIPTIFDDCHIRKVMGNMHKVLVPVAKTERDDFRLQFHYRKDFPLSESFFLVDFPPNTVCFTFKVRSECPML